MVEWLPLKTIDYMSIEKGIRNIVLEEPRVKLTLITRHVEMIEEITEWIDYGGVKNVEPYGTIFPISINVDNNDTWHFPKYTVIFESMKSKAKTKSFYFPQGLFEI